MAWEPQNETRDREIKRRLDAGERAVDLASEYGLSPLGLRSVLRRLRSRDMKAAHARSVQSTKAMRPVHRPAVRRLSADLMAEITAARAEMATAPIYRGGW